MTTFRPLRASVLAELGRAAEAKAIIAPTPRDCYACLIARAQADEASGMTDEADLGFARAIRSGRSLPQAYFAWGQARLDRGDLEGAIVQFRAAHSTGPRWADPLKGWGDALVAQGNMRAAVDRYQEAAELSPNWGGLHLAWGQALDKQGKWAEAAQRYRRAAGLDLSAADRARVAELSNGGR